MRPWLVVLALFAVPAVTSAQSQVPSIRDVIELSKASVGDEVILALIEVNQSVYPTDPETLKTLKTAGVSPAVIVAMVKSGRTRREEAPAPVRVEPDLQPQPQVIVVDHEPAEPRVREVAVPVAVPVYITVPSRRHDVRPGHPPVKPAEPVYWGWGGKRRPDSWKTAADVQKDAKVPPAQKK